MCSGKNPDNESRNQGSGPSSVTELIWDFSRTFPLCTLSFYETDGPVLWVPTTQINCIKFMESIKTASSFYTNTMSTVQDKKNGYILSVCVKISDRNSPWSLFHNTELQQPSNAWAYYGVEQQIDRFLPGHPHLPFLRSIRIFSYP